MKSLIRFALFACIALGMVACTQVPPGNVGVLVNLTGGDKGVSNTTEVAPGYVWVGPFRDLYLFPTFSQTRAWQGGEALSFSTVEGMTVTADVGITFSVMPDHVTGVFQKYRRGIDEIEGVFLHNMVRDALVIEASTKPIEYVYGKGKAELIESVLQHVRKQTQPIGINVENIYWAGAFRLPEQVAQSLNAKMAATQMAQQRENEIKTAEAEAMKAVAQAKGEADSRLLVAKAEAEAIRIRGDALRENPRLVELQAVEKWNGVLPTYMMGSGATPFITVPTGNKQ